MIAEAESIRLFLPLRVRCENIFESNINLRDDAISERQNVVLWMFSSQRCHVVRCDWLKFQHWIYLIALHAKLPKVASTEAKYLAIIGFDLYIFDCISWWKILSVERLIAI